jgi:hypothetical protein
MVIIKDKSNFTIAIMVVCFKNYVDFVMNLKSLVLFKMGFMMNGKFIYLSGNK